MKNHRSILFTLTSLFMIAPLGCDEPLELDAEAELDDREVELSGESPSADAALFEADLAEADQVNVGELGQPSCSTVNLDSDSTCRMLDGVSQCGQQIAGYNGEYGWTQWWWPTHYQHYCHSPNNKWRLYWYQPWVKAPANRPAIRLRYQGPNPCCDRESYTASYLKDASGQNYLRVQFSSDFGGTCACDAADY
ncbi:MAG TPA: hypothetical protein VK034_03370, partial [Enhygromyxa sp.]|nr:hypothetical protein [Enhygromyxa sp.]